MSKCLISHRQACFATNTLQAVCLNRGLVVQGYQGLGFRGQVVVITCMALLQRGPSLLQHC